MPFCSRVVLLHKLVFLQGVRLHRPFLFQRGVAVQVLFAPGMRLCICHFCFMELRIYFVQAFVDVCFFFGKDYP